MGEHKVVFLAKVGEVSAYEGGDGFNKQEEEGVDCWKFEIGGRHRGL